MGSFFKHSAFEPLPFDVGSLIQKQVAQKEPFTQPGKLQPKTGICRKIKTAWNRSTCKLTLLNQQSDHIHMFKRSTLKGLSVREKQPAGWMLQRVLRAEGAQGSSINSKCKGNGCAAWFLWTWHKLESSRNSETPLRDCLCKSDLSMSVSVEHFPGDSRGQYHH